MQFLVYFYLNFLQSFVVSPNTLLIYCFALLLLIYIYSVFFKVWLEEPLSNFERPLIFFLLFLSVLIFVYTIVEADFERPLDNFERPFRFLKTP